MERIIATTDFSANSKAGLRYAIHLAHLRKAEVVFLHVHQVLKASFWSEEQYQGFINRSKEVIMADFPAFIKSVYRSMSMQAPEQIAMAVHHNLDTVDGILEYAQKTKASYICISTRGAGGLKKIYGTIASRLIRLSSIPVLCIPSSYRTKPINSILYASDMTGYEAELHKIVAFAKPLEAKIDMLHLSYPYEFMEEQTQIEKRLNKKIGYKVNLYYQPRDIERSIIEELGNAVRKLKPSLLVLFTHQERSLFERILLSGNAKRYSFNPTIPLLSFPKEEIATLAEKRKSLPNSHKKAI